MTSEAGRVSVMRYWSNFAFVRLIALSTLLLAVTILATIVTRLFVPPAGSPGHQWVMMKNLLLPVILVWVYGRAVRLLERRKPREISLENGVVLFSCGGTIGVAIMAVYVLILWAISAAHLTGEGATQGVLSAVNELLVPWTTAVGEELLFRLILFRLAEETLGTAPAVAISALLFGLSHAANPGANALGLLFMSSGVGVLLAFAFAATRSIWFPVGVHMGWNFSEGCLFGLANSGQMDPFRIIQTTLSGPAIFTGGVFGPEGSVLLFALTLVATVPLWRLAVRRGRWRPMRLYLRAASESAGRGGKGTEGRARVVERPCGGGSRSF